MSRLALFPLTCVDSSPGTTPFVPSITCWAISFNAMMRAALQRTSWWTKILTSSHR